MRALGQDVVAPAAEPMFMHGRCHMSSPTWCAVLPGGVIEITCAECTAVVVRFAMAEKSVCMHSETRVLADEDEAWRPDEKPITVCTGCGEEVPDA